MVLSSTEEPLMKSETHSLNSVMSTLSALWAGDLDGDRVPEIIVGGIMYEAGISKGTLVEIEKGKISSLARLPSTSRTVVMTVGNAVEDKGKEIVVGSEGLYVYTSWGQLLREKSTVGDVTALLAVDMEGEALDKIIYGTSQGQVVFLSGLEEQSEFTVPRGVKYLFQRDETTIYVITSHTVHCCTMMGEQVWSYAAQEEIRSVAGYDVDNDSHIELIILSGSRASLLSYDGKSRNLLSFSFVPSSCVVSDITRDGKPDLILTNTKGYLLVYSDLKQQVQSTYVERVEDTIPLLFATDITADGKPDIIFGGVSSVIIFANSVATQVSVTKGDILLSQAKDYAQKREYERALNDFTEAEKFFTESGDAGKAAECRTYIDELSEIVDILSRARFAYDEGIRLHEEGDFLNAKIQFEAAVQEYELLAQKDDYYTSFKEDAYTKAQESYLALADAYHEQGEAAYQEGGYKEARDLFEKAAAIYTELGNEKALSIQERLDEIEKMVIEVENGEERNLLLYGGIGVAAVLIVFGLVVSRKKVSARLEKGHVYLLLESQPKKSIQLMKEYSRLGYEGLVISRVPAEQIQKKLKKQKILQLSSAVKEDSISPDNVVNILLRMKEFMTSKKSSILLLDGIDYIALQNSFEDSLNLIQKLIESVTLYKGILLVSVNPKGMEEKELIQLEEEMELLEL
jgi:tetratricopeptide (TPR) repeat protein